MVSEKDGGGVCAEGVDGSRFRQITFVNVAEHLEVNMDVVTRLADNLLPALQSANEIWVAVALINRAGLGFILGNVPTNCKMNFLVGVDLPSHPRALRDLYNLQNTSNMRVRVRLFPEEQEFYHPKLYIIERNDSFVGFVGSANCTNGGLNKNIELTIQIDDQKICNGLKSWFDSVFDRSVDLRDSSLQKYEADYAERQRRESEERKVARKDKKQFKDEAIASLKEKDKFIRILREYRQRPDYAKIKKKREIAVDRLRKSLDYRNFNHIDVDQFFSIQDLGHIISLPKPTIKREINRFSEMLRVLCDEKIGLVQRYNRAIEGDLKIRGVNEGLVSKVLAVHNPKEYYVKNEKSDKALKKYGIELPRGLSKGERYEITCKLLKGVYTETGFDDFAVFDHYLYLEGGGK